MKKLRLLIGFLLIVNLEGKCLPVLLTDKAPADKARDEIIIRPEERTNPEEAVYWEESRKAEDPAGINSFAGLLEKNDNDKLYAPPPGETGNPQKIVAPLGTGDVALFLLLSAVGLIHRLKGFKRKLST
jgi:hypothetical protein